MYSFNKHYRNFNAYDTEFFLYLQSHIDTHIVFNTLTPLALQNTSEINFTISARVQAAFVGVNVWRVVGNSLKVRLLFRQWARL